RARFVVVTADPTAEVHQAAAAAGALFTLAKPVTARALLDFLRGRTTGPTPQAGRPAGGAPEDADLVDVALMARLQGLYADAL
ncbi:hypothetical protein ACQ1ZK_20690, partial [Enterococcus faecium]